MTENLFDLDKTALNSGLSPGNMTNYFLTYEVIKSLLCRFYVTCWQSSLVFFSSGWIIFAQLKNKAKNKTPTKQPKTNNSWWWAYAQNIFTPMLSLSKVINRSGGFWWGVLLESDNKQAPMASDLCWISVAATDWGLFWDFGICWTATRREGCHLLICHHGDLLHPWEDGPHSFTFYFWDLAGENGNGWKGCQRMKFVILRSVLQF